MRLSEDHTSDCDSLLLATGDVGPLDSHVLVEALALRVRSVVFLLFGLLDSEPYILKLLDLRVEVGLIGGIPDILKSSLMLVVLDIISDGLIEEDGLLADHTK